MDKGNDVFGFSPFNTMFGENVVVSRVDDIAVKFNYGIMPRHTTSTTANGGTVTESASLVAIASGTSATGTAKLQSIDTVRYRPGHMSFAFFTAMFSAPTATSTQYAGAFTDVDGILIGYTGNDFSIVKRSNSVDEVVTQANFNHSVLTSSSESRFQIDPQKINIYGIMYGYLGVAPITVAVMDNYGKWIPIHTFNTPNQLTGVSIRNPNLPITIESKKTSGASSVSVSCGSFNGGTYGAPTHFTNATHVFAKSFATTLVGATTKHIATLRNDTTHNSKTNNISISVLYIAASTEGQKPVSFRLMRNATLTGTSYTAHDETNSVISIDTAGTYSSGGVEELLIPVAKTDNTVIVAGDNELHLQLRPGETMSILADSAQASDVSFAIRWEEMQ